MFSKVLIANRGAISCRIQRTLKAMGVEPVIVHSTADRESLHVLEAETRVHLPGNTPVETYLDMDSIISAAQQSGAEAIHPGYGFLSENSAFAEACEREGIVFLGPTAEQLETCGLKHVCHDIARDCGVKLLEGSGLIKTSEEALEASLKIGFPVIIKSSAGGGGIGMQVAYEEGEVAELFSQVQRLSVANFADDSVFIEKYIERARHLEVQVFGDGKGKVWTFGERDCSTQRRNQKVIEETPAPNLQEAERAEIIEAARRMAESVSYRSAGTIEFLWDERDREFYFLEINARLQVEHGVTEEVWGVDLVELMVCLGAEALPESMEFSPSGHAIQVRLYAEDPYKNFQPSAGLITHFQPSLESDRCDRWVQSGTVVSPFYDPMLAKVVTHEPTREEATATLLRELETTTCYGIETNLNYLQTILRTETFQKGTIYTRFLNSFSYEPHTLEVLEPGLETTVQDYPGRTGRWDVGVPPSGPFDPLHFRVGNAILGNAEDAAGIEMSVKGATYRFHAETMVCLTGADMQSTLNGDPLRRNEPIKVQSGDVLKCGLVSGGGQRGYLCISGGIQVPAYMGSRATFKLGKFGGHGGRSLLPSDILHYLPYEEKATVPLKAETLPVLDHTWDLHVTYGPHGAPEFFTEEDIKNVFSEDWEVHYNSDRTGIRLIGPKPDWARTDGGEAGLHPSNIHDNAYAIGAVDFTGDMPILLGPDGPSLGGFVCPAVIIKADLWKMGQLKPGDKIRFHCVSIEEAETLLREAETRLLSLTEPLEFPPVGAREAIGEQVVRVRNPEDQMEKITYRQGGDGVVLIEFGQMELDLNLRFKTQAFYEWIRDTKTEGITELVPGVRSLQLQFDPKQLTMAEILQLCEKAEAALPEVNEMEFQSRIIHLPLCWDDPCTQLAIEKYTQLVRDDAPWCPSNIEFIRRINGLQSVEEVKEIVYNASYFVMGLGDVYLGAPVATPLDPRHRLITTKYNPARTWTPENAVGIGGAYLCIYGMEGPGGYQFVGRTIPIWNRYIQTEQFQKPWLLRFFDQICWFPVSEKDLGKIRRDFLTGDYEVKIEHSTFRVKEYNAFLTEQEDSIIAFKAGQQAAFNEERAEWERTGAMNFSVDEKEILPSAETIEIPEDCEAVYSPIIGSMWKVQLTDGDPVTKGESLMIIESMKTEFTISSTASGTVERVLVSEGDAVQSGQLLAIIKP